MSSAERAKRRLRLGQYLNTEVGLELMEELSLLWDGPSVFDPDPNITIYNVGKRDAFRDMQLIAEFNDE